MDNLNYGVIGNGKTAALISQHGAIEWLCLPDFNAPSQFAKILDVVKGGEFAFHAEGYQVSQRYWHNTNILVTTFSQGENVFEVWDFMPIYKNETGDFYYPADIIRYVKYVSGKPSFKVKYDPRLNYAKGKTSTFTTEEYIKSFSINGAYESIYLYSNLPNQSICRGKAIDLDRDAFFLISYNEKIITPTVEKANLELQRTEVYWLNWVDKGFKFKAYNQEIIRSSLVLRLLTFNKTGAIIAAVTTSLPETIGEERNWDYRFCWIRDAAMMVNVLIKIGYRNEARRFLNFILDIVPGKDDRIQIMYGIRGEKKLTESTLDHLAGYKNSKPVRIGNAAYHQKQHDIYGVLVDVIYQDLKNFHVALDDAENLWTITRGVLNTVEVNWKKTDQSIWEFRNEEKHFTFSKILCWVAADRGVKIAKLLNKPYYVEQWTFLSDHIKEDIHANAWNEELQAFTQAYENKYMDASNLLMEYYGFIEPTDPKFISTVKKTYEELAHKGMMYRYKNEDDFGLPSSSFTICTFWMIRSLFKIGEKEMAREMFDNLLLNTNHLGLLSEDMDFESKRLLGNFPQGYSHLALIETAMMFAGGYKDDDRVLQQLMS
ncbi:MAG: glycoside hydrolase family 15 protein [Cyclobacteriaceae bacterium]